MAMAVCRLMFFSLAMLRALWDRGRPSAGGIWGDLRAEDWHGAWRWEASLSRRQSPWEPGPLLPAVHDHRLDLPLQPLEVVRALRAIAVAAGRLHAMPSEGQGRLQRVQVFAARRAALGP